MIHVCLIWALVWTSARNQLITNQTWWWVQSPGVATHRSWLNDCWLFTMFGFFPATLVRFISRGHQSTRLIPGNKTVQLQKGVDQYVGESETHVQTHTQSSFHLLCVSCVSVYSLQMVTHVSPASFTVMGREPKDFKRIRNARAITRGKQDTLINRQFIAQADNKTCVGTNKRTNQPMNRKSPQRGERAGDKWNKRKPWGQEENVKNKKSSTTGRAERLNAVFMSVFRHEGGMRIRE